MATSNVVPLVILFMAMHVSLAVVDASVTTAKGGAPPAVSNTYEAARRAVHRSLARAKETVSILTRTMADLKNNGTRVTALEYCFQFAERNVGDLKTAETEMAKGKGKIDPKGADAIMDLLDCAVYDAGTCLDGLMDVDLSDPRLGPAVDHLSVNMGVFDATLHIVARALNQTLFH